MVALISKSQIEDFNIDTVEKALIFGSVSLRSALVGSDNGNTDDTNISSDISTSGTEASLSINILLPYNSYAFNTSGGLLLESIEELASDSSTLGDDLNLISSPSNSGLVMPDFDESVINTFEKYLAYYSMILWASFESKSNSVISFLFLGNQEESSVQISLSLPLDLNKWLAGSNYLDASLTSVDSYFSPFPGDDQDSGGQQQGPVGLYSVSFDNPDAYLDYEFHAVTRPGILESMSIDADYATESGIFFTSLLLNEQELVPEQVVDYEDGSYDLVFDTVDNPIFLEPGDVLTFTLFEEPVPTYVDINTYIFEGQI